MEIYLLPPDHPFRHYKEGVLKATNGAARSTLGRDSDFHGPNLILAYAYMVLFPLLGILVLILAGLEFFTLIN